MGKIRKIQPATVILYLGRDVANCHVVFFLFLTLAFAMKHSSQIQRSKWAKRGGWVGISTSTDAESSSLWVSRVIKGQKTRVKWQLVCPLVMSISLLFIPCLPQYIPEPTAQYRSAPNTWVSFDSQFSPLLLNVVLLHHDINLLDLIYCAFGYWTLHYSR